MRQRLVAGNWKMHGSRDGVKVLVDDLTAGIDRVKSTGVAVCPPYVFLPEVGNMLRGTPIALGAQDVCQIPGEGAYTGEVSAAMLREFDCRYVIVGHSERRHVYNESDTLVIEKFVAAREKGLTPILCVGETLEQRKSNQTEKVIGDQLEALFVLEHGADELAYAVIAYEPVWAIGTGRTATPDEAQEMHAFIRGRVADYNSTIAEQLTILYGGSVKAANAADLFAMEDIDGGLIGGASLKADEFLAICAAAD